MYSNLSQQANIYADNVRNEVVSATLGTNEYICHTENCSYTPTYDANGNITSYVDVNGNVAAQYKYSAFGEIISQSGESFTHLFSTKPYCPTTGLIEYQFRKYDPVLGRWLSRDPIEEAGGLNLYAFCENNLCNNYDFNGFETYSSITFKRNHIQFFNAIMSELKTNYPQGDYYGHWWVEFGGESYGWWPKKPVGFIETFLGVEGEINGITNYKG